jgi:hypothetical protein
LGEGQLSRWEKNWNLLPYVLAPTWQKMEYTASRRVGELNQLEADLLRMETPAPAWKETLRDVVPGLTESRAEPVHKIVMGQIKAKKRILESEQKLTIPLNQKDREDSLQMAGAWCQALKAQCTHTPSTVFMGGSLEKASLVLFLRPLVADDFIDLWSV